VQLGLGLGLGIAAAYTAAMPWLPLAFTDDADVAAAVWALLPLVICMLPLNALVYVLDGVLLGASDFKFLAGVHTLSAGRYYCTMPAATLLPRGVAGVADCQDIRLDV
jgi:Na+-driven multidrug efflux pump